MPLKKNNLRIKLRLHFLLIIFILLIIVSIHNAGTVNLPFDTVRVRILGKYKLNKIIINIDEGRLFLAEKTIPIKNKKITITRSGNSLTVKTTNRRYKEKFAGISSKKNFRISFKNNSLTQTRIYNGSLDIKSQGDSLVIVNSIQLEDFVHASAIAELGPLLNIRKRKIKSKKWKNELISAMEIAIRSYLFSNKDRHKSKEYQFCDLTHCVFFPGISPGQIKNRTGGMVLLDKKGGFLEAFFHSTCGGILSGPEVFWHRHVAGKNFRRGLDRMSSSGEFHCSMSPHSKWESVVSINDLRKILKTKYIEDLAAIYKQKRVTSLSYSDRDSIKRKINMASFMSNAGRLLGWNVIKSNFFTLKKIGSRYIFKGRGLGHGIGLCQWGACKMAIDGKSYKDILRFYYNNAKILRN